MNSTRLSGRLAAKVLDVVLLVSLATGAPLFAQVAGGTVQGVVSDPSGAAIAGAQVTITEVAIAM